MSTTAAGPLPYLYAQQGDQDSPASVEIPGSVSIEPSAATATFDGTGASGSFLACLTFRAQSGELLSRVFPQTQVAAGDVAQVSYAPFPGGMISPGGGGIEFDTDNEGGYLDVTTNDNDGAGYGMQLANGATGGQRITSTGETAGYAQEFLNNGNGTTLILVQRQGGLEITLPDHDNTGITTDVHGNDNAGIGTFIAGTNNSGWTLDVSGTGNSGISIRGRASAGGGVSIQALPTERLGFFGHAVVVQQPTPVTLGDVIALLRAYGLAA